MNNPIIKNMLVRYVAKGIINPSGPKSCKKMDIDLIAHKCDTCNSIYEKRVDFGKCRCSNRDIRDIASLTLVHIIGYYNPNDEYDWEIDEKYNDSVIIVRPKPNKFSDIYFLLPNSTIFKHVKIVNDEEVVLEAQEEVIFTQETKTSDYFLVIRGPMLKITDNLYKVRRKDHKECPPKI